MKLRYVQPQMGNPSIGFTPAFLAALLMGIADAGYEIKFSNVMIISKVV